MAILTGDETREELEKLADDVYLLFRVGLPQCDQDCMCRQYMILFRYSNAFKKYDYLIDHHKYKNNYDYNLAIHLLNKKYLYEQSVASYWWKNASYFSPISQLNYEFYNELDILIASLTRNPAIQCIAGKGFITFGQAQ